MNVPTVRYDGDIGSVLIKSVSLKIIPDNNGSYVCSHCSNFISMEEPSIDWQCNKILLPPIIRQTNEEIEGKWRREMPNQSYEMYLKEVRDKEEQLKIYIMQFEEVINGVIFCRSKKYHQIKPFTIDTYNRLYSEHWKAFASKPSE